MFKDGKGRELPSFADSIVDHMETIESTGTLRTK